MNLAMLLEMVADSAPDHVVLGTASGGVTAAALLERSRSAAGLFASHAVDHVAFIGLNSEAVPVAMFGAAMAGVPFVPLSYRLTDVQLSDVLSRVAPAIVVAEAADMIRLQSLGAAATVSTAAIRGPAVRAESSSIPPFVDPEAVAILLFTSGTTAKPKAAVLRHRHLVSYVIAGVEFMGSDPSEAQLVSVPPYHIAGIAAILSSLYGGRRIVYLPQFEPQAWVETVREQSITHAMVVPTMLGRILQVLEAEALQLPSLRHLSCGGGRMPVEMISTAMARLPQVDFVNAYGLTETSSTIALLSPADHREALASRDPSVRKRLGSVGRPLESVELQIRDPAGQIVSPGSVGEIWVRGEQVAGEYLERSDLTADSWFPTRDAGHVDEAGYLYLDGRLDDVIVRGAENISPGEVEDVLIRHPAIVEAAVVGVPDPEWGEAVAAVVVLADGAEASGPELQEWVKARLRSVKTPGLVQFRAELPYSETGKLLRRVLRAELGSVAASREASARQ